jgi:hypothetical protein
MSVIDDPYHEVSRFVGKRAVPRDLPDLTGKDPVNHPAHYTSGRIEVIDFIEDQKFDYHLGQVIKYVARAGKKDVSKKLEDLRKAEWYLKRAISRINYDKG